MDDLFDDSFQKELRTSSWSLYSVGILLIVVRLFTRWRQAGYKFNFQVDDYLMLPTVFFFTALVVCLNLAASGHGLNLYPAELEATMSAEERASRVYSSKMVVLVEQALLNVIYILKACMLLIYTRLTLGLFQAQFVRYLSVYVFLGWLATQITFFSACRPFNGYWAAPPPMDECATYHTYSTVQAVFNITSDVLMLGIPLPLVISLTLPWKQKLILVFVFSLGVFVPIAAILNKVYSYINPDVPVFMLWYAREASVAVYVTNLPVIWPLLRDVFPCLKTMGSSDRYKTNNKTKSTGVYAGGRTQTGGKGNNTFVSTRTIGGNSRATPSQGTPGTRRSSLGDIEGGSSDSIELESIKNGASSQAGAGSDRYGSQEHIVSAEPHQIVVSRTIAISEERMSQQRTSMYDWNSQGNSKYSADAAAQKSPR